MSDLIFIKILKFILGLKMKLTGEGGDTKTALTDTEGIFHFKYVI